MLKNKNETDFDGFLSLTLVRARSQSSKNCLNPDDLTALLIILELGPFVSNATE